jgi:acyl-CoA thioesterase-1
MRLPPNYGEPYTKAFEHAFADLAKRRKTALLPCLLEGFGDKAELFQADHIHPTEAAQPAVLKNVWGALAPLLRK